MADKTDIFWIFGIFALVIALIGLVLPEQTSSFPSSYPYGNLTDVPQTFPYGNLTGVQTLYQLSLMKFSPYYVASTMSPSTHTSTRVWLFPFEIESNITINKIITRTGGVVADCLYLGIFNSTGNLIWKSDLLSTIDGFKIMTNNFPITLNNGLYYFASTNNNVTSSSAAYRVASLSSSAYPRWGYITGATTNGIMPNSINVESITEESTGFMIFTFFSYWTT